MLVLTRKIDEAIVIGKDIEVVVLAVKGDSIKLGIKAPKDVPIKRKEIFDLASAANLLSVHAPIDTKTINEILDESMPIDAGINTEERQGD